MFKIRTVVAAACVSVLMSGAASAATFNFQSNGADNNSTVAFGPVDGVSLVVDAFKVFNPSTTTFTDGDVNQGSNGLGVSGDPEGGRLGAGEGLQFQFSPNVSVVSSLVFERGDQNEDFIVFDDTNTQVGGTFTVLGGGAGNSTQLFDLSALNIVGSFFTIVGIDSGGGNRGVRIAELTVTPVPLPAALPLFAGGLGLLGLLGWRRKRASA